MCGTAQTFKSNSGKGSGKQMEEFLGTLWNYHCRKTRVLGNLAGLMSQKSAKYLSNSFEQMEL